jgi:nucleotide-binding universal stress UspA family protein
MPGETLSTPEAAPILLCYDRSEGAKHAIEAAGALLRGRRAIVLHVWSPVAVIAAAYGGLASLPSYDDADLQKAAEKLVEEGVQAAVAAGFDAKSEVTEVSYNGTSRTILEVADKHDAALIVLGARGLSSFRSLLLGSVSHGVAQHAHRPVLIVPPAVKPAE